MGRTPVPEGRMSFPALGAISKAHRGSAADVAALREELGE
jgi:hypothetical protein